MLRHPAIFFEIMQKRLSTRIIVLVLVFTVLGAYYPAIFAPLNSVDDPGMYHYLLNTDTFRFRDIFIPGASGAYYRPILIVSFLIDKFAWGLEESFMHLDNVLFHLINTLLLFAIARRVSTWLKVESPLPALVVALFFAVHPLNTESVVWISGRTDLLAGMFILLATYLLLSRRRNGLLSLLAACSLLLACLAKDTAIFFLPAAIMLPFFLPAEEEEGVAPNLLKWNNIFHICIFTATGLGYFVFRKLAFSRGDLGVKQVMTHVVGGEREGILLSLRLVLKSAGFYVKKLFVPFPLNFSINHVSDFYSIIGLVLLLIVIRLLIRRTIPGFFFIAAVAIGSSALLVPLLKMTWTPIAERYMYMPSAFFVLGITYTAYPWTREKRFQRFMVPMVACLAAVAVYGTAQRAILWQDNLALYEDCRKKSPDFVPAQNEIANALYARGKTEEAARIIKSIVPPKELINNQYVQISKAAALANEGNRAAAHDLLVQALQNPGKHEVAIIERILKLNDLQIAQGEVSRAKRYPENIRLLARLFELTGDPFYLYRLGQVHMLEGERDQAREAFQRVVSQASQQAYYYSAAKRLQEKMAD